MPVQNWNWTKGGRILRFSFCLGPEWLAIVRIVRTISLHCVDKTNGCVVPITTAEFWRGKPDAVWPLAWIAINSAACGCIGRNVSKRWFGTRCRINCSLWMVSNFHTKSSLFALESVNQVTLEHNLNLLKSWAPGQIRFTQGKSPCNLRLSVTS